jgi:hypothetical protein
MGERADSEPALSGQNVEVLNGTTSSTSSHSSRPHAAAGKQTRSQQLAPTVRPSGEQSDHRRAVEALEQARRALALLEAQAERLTAALDTRDFLTARAAAEAIRSLQPGIAGSLSIARRAGAAPEACANLQSRAATLAARLDPLLALAPQAAPGLGLDLLDPMADDAAAASWSASLATADIDVHRLSGLPPGTQSQVARHRDGGLKVVLALTGIAAPEGSQIPLTAAHRRELVRALEDFVGVPMDSPARSELLADDSLSSQVVSGTLGILLDRADGEHLFSPPMYQAWLELDEPVPSQSSQSSQSSQTSAESSRATAAPEHGHKQTQPASAEQTWLQRNVPLSATAPPRSPSSPAPDALISELLRDKIAAVEAHPERQRILALLRSPAAQPRDGEPLTGRRLEQLIIEAEHAAARERAGLSDRAAPEPTWLDSLGVSDAVDHLRQLSPLRRPDDSAPIFDYPVRATIFRNTSSAEQPALFNEQTRLWIHVDWPQRRTGDEADPTKYRQPHAECDWVFECADGALRFTARSEGREPRIEHTFPFPVTGASRQIWTVQAFVRHNYFLPARVQTTFTLETAQSQLAALRAESFEELGTTSRSSKSFGEGFHDQGTALRGALPAEFQRRTPAQRRQQLEQELARLEQLHGVLRQNLEHPEAAVACERQLEHLRASREAQQADWDRGWQPFEIRGFFYGRGNHALDGALELAAQVLPQFFDGTPQLRVRLRDLTRRLSAEATCFDGAGESFEIALERAFHDLCKHYPAGTVSILAERIEGAGTRASGQTLGFELQTDTTWKDVKADVFSPAVSAATNLAAALAMIFCPATIPVLMPLTVAYNATQTVDEMVEAWRSGALTPSKGVLSLAQIGLDLLPVIGRARILQSSKLAFALFEGLDWGGQALVMTLQAQAQIAALCDLDIAQMAVTYTELLELQRSSHPSDPRLVEKRAAIERTAQAIRGRTNEVWTSIIEQSAATMLPVRVASHLRPASAHAAGGEAPFHVEPDEPSKSDASPQGRTAVFGPAGEGAPTHAAGEREHLAALAQPDSASQRNTAGDPQPRIFLLGDDQRSLAAAKRLPPKDGYVDVFIHGTADQLKIVLLRGDVELTPRQLAAYLRKQGLGGARIRLLGCSTGESPNAVAQHLANALRSDVLAPTKKFWIGPHGEFGVGDHVGDRDGKLEPFDRRPASTEKRPSLLEKELEQRPGDNDVDQPTATQNVADDRRARMSNARPDQLELLQQALRAPVVIDETMVDGVKIRARRVKRAIGSDLIVDEIRVGKHALTSDVLAHHRTIAEIERYNGTLGKLRQLADSVKRWRAGAPSGFPHGSRGWVTEQELGKLGELLDARNGPLHAGSVDDVTLQQEIDFLEGRKLFHQEVLRSIGETGGDPAHALTFERPDTGEVTRDALAAGYQLPGAEHGASPDWYYYRNSQALSGQYELVRKPTAPMQAPGLRARLVGDQFTGFESLSMKPAAEVPHDWSAAQVTEHLRATPGFGEYAEMLEAQGIASAAVVDGTIRHALDRRRMKADAPITTEAIRHDVKASFRDRVAAHVCDPSLGEQASYARLHATIDKLAPADRGAIAEVWHLTRNAPDAKAHVSVDVERSSGKNAGRRERRVLDAVQGKTAIEIKDITGPIDRDQFGAYVDLLSRPRDGSAPQIKKLTYVFTNPTGAIANLEFFGEQMNALDLRGMIKVEVFDRSGRRHLATSKREALELKTVLEGDVL